MNWEVAPARLANGDIVDLWTWQNVTRAAIHDMMTLHHFRKPASKDNNQRQLEGIRLHITAVSLHMIAHLLYFL